MFDQILYRFRTGDIITRLILINVGVFLLINIIAIIANLGGLDMLYTSGGGVRQLFLTEYLSANSSWKLTLYRPWTIITYMFTHEDLWHILVNMLIFFYIGQLFIDLLGDKRMLPLYIFGGIAGLLLYILAFNTIPALSNGAIPIIGASASVMAVMVATATHVPNYQIRLIFFGAVPLKYVVGVYVLLDVLALRGNANMGGHIAHLGGAIYGFVYAKQLSNGTDFSNYFYDGLRAFTDLFRKKPKIKVVHKQAPKTKKSPLNQQARVDEILDKISKSGYENLTQEEKDFLFNASKNK